jgi:hypothetical protein
MLYLGVCRCQPEWPYGWAAVPGMGAGLVLDSSVVTPPAVPPLSLAEVKLAHKIEFDDEDSYITALILAATDYTERYLGLSLVTQTRSASMAAWPADAPMAAKLLPYGPVQEITAVDGDTPPYVVTYVAGYPPTDPEPPAEPDLTANIPAGIKQAMQLQIGTWFENRENDVIGTSVGGTLSIAVRQLLDFHRARRGFA